MKYNIIEQIEREHKKVMAIRNKAINGLYCTENQAIIALCDAWVEDKIIFCEKLADNTNEGQ